MKQRDTGLDIFRLLCCTCVVSCHVMQTALPNTVAKAVFYAGLFCAPGFFMLSGYLLANHTELKIGYIEKKIGSTLAKLLGWFVLWAIVTYMATGTYESVLWPLRFVLSESWFLLTYCLLLLCAYPLARLQQRWKWGFAVGVGLWMIGLALGLGKEITYSRTQTLWLHTYMGFFALGMALNPLKKLINAKVSKKLQLAVSAPVAVALTVITVLRIRNGEPSYHYGDWYFSLWALSLFWAFSSIECRREKACRLISRMAANTFVVYLGHLPLVKLFASRVPQPEIWVGYSALFTIVLFAAMQGLAELFRRLPLLRKLV